MKPSRRHFSPRATLVLWLVSLLCQALRAAYPIQLGTAGQEYGKALCVDSAGDIVIAALFQNTLDVDPTSGSTVVGQTPGIDLLLAKYTDHGTLVWARSLSGPATGASASVVITPHGVATDSDDNIYLTGYFGLAGSTTQATVDFDPGPGVANLTNTGGWDPFLAKYDSAGNLLWARTFGATTPATATDERAWDLAVDASGAAYVTGFITGAYDLDPGPAVVSVTSAGQKDVFLVKFDASGNFVWGFTLGDTTDSAASLKESSVAVDADGRVYLSAHFNGTLDVDPGAGVVNLTSAGGSDYYVARYTSSGAYDGAVLRLGGTLSETAPPGTLRFDPAGNLFLTGKFRGTVDLDPGPAVVAITNPTAADNIWLATYTPDLSLRWGFAIASDGGLDGAHRVAFDAAGNVFLAGWVAGVSDFDPGPATAVLVSRNAAVGAASDNFIAKYTPAGAFLWARGFGSPVTDQTELGIVAGLGVDADGNAYVTGQFFGAEAVFFSGDGVVQPGSPAWSSAGLNDAYVVKYDANGALWQPSARESWRVGFFNRAANLGDAADLADPDADGLPNLLEYAFAADPLAPAIGPNVRITNIGSALQIEFLRARAELTYEVLASSDLVTWSVIATNPGWVGDEVEVTDPVSINPRRFLRLRVTAP